MLLWRGRRSGAILGVAATPLTLAMTIGFAFPFLFAAIPIRLVLTVAGLAEAAVAPPYTAALSHPVTEE